MIEQTTTYDLMHVKDVQLKGADKFFDVWILDTNTLVANKQRLSDYSTNGGRQICCLDTDNDVSDVFNGIVRVMEWYVLSSAKKFEALYEGTVVNANISGFGRYILYDR